ncbi:transcriptional regulator [Mangrovactinospora gilvigrisea]|uniref:Transcriptional regulator n=1 Tax=Mangrovactinospora gilvigrisea TaxID=1428644 RepID=A0A1J7BI65_9ACTN|nr:winged helix-turn-helix domain-containing protein [Mangrovactinospora gilvigrisea]OIV38277.1 transcriptional regulator [Mangrovactinospora gilvigrisea]
MSRTHDPSAGAQPQADIARVAAAIGDPTRARILLALGDGRALPASALAREAGVAASTMSGHLARLVELDLVRVEPNGRHRYYRLSGGEVVDAMESLAVIAPPMKIRSLREGTRSHALRRSRLCYDHLAGRLGTALMGALLDGDVLEGGDGMHHPEEAVQDRLSAYGRDLDYRLTAHGRRAVTGFGVDLESMPARGRPAVRYCVDWSEQRHHLSGALGAALASRMFQLGWLKDGSYARVVHLTEVGRRGLVETFGLDPEWEQEAHPAPAA